MTPFWPVDDSWIAVERPSAADAEAARSFDDEVAIDFPSVAGAVERIRHAFVEGDDQAPPLAAEITLSPNQAIEGAAVPVEVPVRSTCRACGGRGEVWSEPCGRCRGSGTGLRVHRLTLLVPAGVTHGERFRFSVTPPRGPRTRVDVRVAVA